ncbi:MAG: bifunctional phosphopantothenoylcysteine decarboxylase/phosphopantothenate--cysteine ligase CoaBC, partial [Myxococcales bacterium]|nr:bifunctional phosphopantothenoylcysteine decarboxylase/phosphopantothenate--cysteine ligase CoaBC [Myxococcales bacterium]
MAEQNGQSTSDRRRVTLAVCGGVAAYKACELARLLIKADFEVDVVMSRSAQRFIGPLLFEALTGRPTLTDESVGEGGRAYAHLDLGQTCDLVAVVPATANVIGKMAHGIADDELTTMLLAATAPVALAPAMNTGMWQNPIVQQNLERLRRVAGVTIVEPSAGELACGAVGPGRLAEPTAIFERLCAMLEPKPLAGVRVLISAGPTWEAIDPVRLLTNRSTGRMGYELARVAQRRGAEV